MCSLARLARGLALGLAALPGLLDGVTTSATVARAAYANPGACAGDCWTHDPAVVKRASDGAYFRFSTGGGLGIYKAGALTGSWTYQGVVLTGGSSISVSGNDGSDAWVS